MTYNPNRFNNIKVITPSITIGNAYTNTGKQCMGGLITVSTGLAANTQIYLQKISLNVAGTTTGSGAINTWVFNSNPSSSTFTDGNDYVLNSADKNSIVHITTSNNLFSGGAGMVDWIPVSAASQIPLTVDSSGNIYIAFTNGTTAWASTVSFSSLYVSILY